MNKLASTAVSTLIGGAIVIGVAPSAHASTSIRDKALSVAAAQKEDPYRKGAAGPNAFDCSGLTLYSFKKAGRTLPRTAQGQYNKTHHISSSNRKRGDLVFFINSSGVYHVGIYAGSDKIWNANSGDYRGYKVVLAPIKEYKGRVAYARVN